MGARPRIAAAQRQVVSGEMPAPPVVECHYHQMDYRPSLDLFAQLFVAPQSCSSDYTPSSRLDLNKNLLRLFNIHSEVMALAADRSADGPHIGASGTPKKRNTIKRSLQ